MFLWSIKHYFGATWGYMVCFSLCLLYPPGRSSQKIPGLVWTRWWREKWVPLLRIKPRSSRQQNSHCTDWAISVTRTGLITVTGFPGILVLGGHHSRIPKICLHPENVVKSEEFPAGLPTVYNLVSIMSEYGLDRGSIPDRGRGFFL
jgi:hypothetical protein